MAPSLTRRLIFLLGLLALAAMLLRSKHHAGQHGTLLPNWGLSTTSALTHANATLGFGAILAVSHASSPRRNQLLYAANLTVIDIVVPEQPAWTDQHVDGFRSKESSSISNGSALAWMGHLNAINWFLSTDLETALIIEDDVDWDIRLRIRQVPLAAAAASPSSWEILYIGHCGDTLPSTKLTSHPHIVYQDDSLPSRDDLHEQTSQLMLDLGLPQKSRIAHRSHWPLCTFAYALTRSSAQRILSSFPNEGPGGCQAFDVRILEACRDHDWACYTINPELFRHIEGKSEIASVNDGSGGDDDGTKKRDSGTVNLACPARHADWVAENESTRAWLRERAREGKCLVDRSRMDMGRLP